MYADNLRVLPGTGHLLPLVPSLQALRDAGHTVVVVSAEPLRAKVEGAELDFVPVGPPWHESDAETLLPGFHAAGSSSSRHVTSDAFRRRRQPVCRRPDRELSGTSSFA